MQDETIQSSSNWHFGKRNSFQLNYLGINSHRDAAGDALVAVQGGLAAHRLRIRQRLRHAAVPRLPPRPRRRLCRLRCAIFDRHLLSRQPGFRAERHVSSAQPAGILPSVSHMKTYTQLAANSTAAP